jgi:hypothetical protein
LSLFSHLRCFDLIWFVWYFSAHYFWTWFHFISLTSQSLMSSIITPKTHRSYDIPKR